MNGKIKGWTFLRPQRKLSADGSTTLDNLRAEKNRLETRLAQIPGLISQLNNNIRLKQQDIDWLNSLNNRRKKKWEKENGGKRLEDVVYQLAKDIVNINAQITTLNNEKNRIPEQIRAIDRQLEAMIQGESQGLSKGLNSQVAAQLGVLELERTKDNIRQEQQLKEIEVQKAKEEQEKKLSPALKWSLIIGGTVLVLIIGYVIYKRSLKAPKAVAPIVSGTPINPVKV